MPNVSAPDFSFIRFDDSGLCLAAHGHHDEAFHFKVIVDKLLSEPIRLGRATQAGVVTYDYSPEVRATWLTARCAVAIAGVGESTTFFLYSIAVGDDEVLYEVDTNLAGLRARLYTDFGITMEGNTFVTSCVIDLQVKAREFQLAGTFLTTTISYFWNEGYIAAPGDAIGYPAESLFRYALLNGDGSTLATTGKFKVLHEQGYTSRISYGCNEAAFGFSYIENTPNIVRLPVWLLKPTYPKRQTVHLRSDGRKQLLSSFVEKEYLLQTELAPEWFHERLAIAMAHDTVIFKNGTVGEVEIMDNEVYQPQWLDDVNALNVPGRSRVKVARYGYFNNNCGTNDCCAPVVAIGEVTTSAILLGLTYSRSTTQIKIRYRLASSSAWTEVIIPSVSSYLITGLTPGENYVVMATAICDGDEGDSSRAHAVATMAPGGGSCEVVGIAGTPLLPDGEVGVPYSYSISLTGAPLFTLFNIVKPSWMTVSLGGILDVNTVHFTGTPDVAGAVTVSFDVSNCSGDGLASFSDSIDIAADPEAGNIIYVQFSSVLELICESSVEAFYVAPPDEDVQPGAMIYYDPALTIPVGPGFITDSTGIIHTINAAGLVTSRGTTSC